MIVTEQIRKNVAQLPPDKQIEVLDFITFLQQRVRSTPSEKRRSLKDHAAFGLWKKRKVDAVCYQQTLRAEWD